MRRHLQVALGALVLTSCFIVRGTDTSAVSTTKGTSYAVLTRVKAHLVDGSTVLYANGLTVRSDTVHGHGTRFNLALVESGTVQVLPLDSIVAMESFHESVRPGQTFLISTVATVGAFGLVIAIACAADPKCFGSCPTIYSDSAGTAVLEAEGFSYSIAPLFERRDIDRLRAQPDARGVLGLEVRNEALETHFINHLELLAVGHAPDEWVTTDGEGRPLAVRTLASPLRARDRAGRNVLPEVRAHDGRVFTTDARTLAAAGADDLDDWIDLDVRVPAGTDSVAVAFRMRNSLLATVLLYDMMLGDQGTRSLDWMARDLTRIGPAMEVATWARQHLGMRLQVWDGNAYQSAGRIGDAGPVAWKDVVTVVPTLGRELVRVRLRFAADNWRIDRIATTAAWRRLAPTTVPLAAVYNGAGRRDSVARAALVAPDELYVESTSGRWLRAEFVAPTGLGERQTYFLASQGYYLEWLRRDWIAGRDSTAFTPGPATLQEAMRRWQSSLNDTERRFYATRVPVR